MIGVYFIIGRFFVDSYQRGRTYYGITNQRILIKTGVFGTEIKSLSLQGLADISLRERSDGSGSIIFGSLSPMNGMWYGTAWPGMGSRLPPAFDLIDDVRRVYDIIREAQARKT